MTTILTLDLGTTAGWAMAANNRHIASGRATFKHGRYEGGGMRFLRFRNWLDELKANSPTEISAIYFEEVRNHKGVDAAHVYGGLLATLTSWCEEKNLPYRGIPVGTIKRHATGKGNAGKEAVIEAMKSKGYLPVDDNHADALALMHCVLDGAI